MKFFLIIFFLVTGYTYCNTGLPAIIELVNQSKLQEAEGALNIFLESHANSHSGHFVMTQIQIQKGRYKEAAVYISQAIKLKKNEVSYLRIAGQIQEKLKANTKALSYWRQCLQHARDSSLINEAKSHIKYLEND